MTSVRSCPLLLSRYSQEVAKGMISFYEACTEKMEAEQETYYDNSDINIYQVFGPNTMRRIAHNREKAFKSNSLWFRLRHETIKCVAKFYKLADMWATSGVKEITSGVANMLQNGSDVKAHDSNSQCPAPTLEEINASITKLVNLWTEIEQADIDITKGVSANALCEPR